MFLLIEPAFKLVKLLLNEFYEKYTSKTSVFCNLKCTHEIFLSHLRVEGIHKFPGSIKVWSTSNRSDYHSQMELMPSIEYSKYEYFKFQQIQTWMHWNGFNLYINTNASWKYSWITSWVLFIEINSLAYLATEQFWIYITVEWAY